VRVFNLAPAHFALSNIALKRLKLTRFHSLNDPFEMLAIDVVSGDLRTRIRAKKSAIDKSEGILCFSKYWKNPLLWSHYADKHRGIALGFDVPESSLKPVRYVARMDKINLLSDEISQEQVAIFLDRLRYTKFKDWQYEDEVRQFFDLHSLSEQGELYFVPFSQDLLLREVILGPHCDIPIEAIRSLVEPHQPQVFVRKARIAYKDFGVTEDRSFRKKIREKFL
jgi:hypothetical protein